MIDIGQRMAHSSKKYTPPPEEEEEEAVEQDTEGRREWRKAGEQGKEERRTEEGGGEGERREGRKGWREGRKEEKGRETIILPEHSNSGSVHTRRSSDGKTYSPHFLGYARQCWEAYRAGRRCSSAGAILQSGFPAGIQRESCVQAGDR